MKNTLMSIALITFSIATQPVRSEVIFQDGFESADMSATNSDGFKWGQNNKTSIVIQDPVDGPVAVYNNRVIANPHSSTMPDGTTRDWTAFEGNYSLRFRYAARDNWAEQKFDIGVPQRDLWISFMWKVPANFEHTPAINNKLLAIWMDGYLTGDGTTLLLQYWPDQAGGSYFWWQRSSNFDTVNAVGTHDGFIKFPEDQGRWMQLVIHLRASSTNATTDGEIEIWRRWDSDSSFTNVADWTGVVPVPTDGPNGWKAGYLMGWSNKGFAVDTEFQIDNFTLSSSSLLTILPRPRPPSLAAD